MTPTIAIAMLIAYVIGRRNGKAGLLKHQECERLAAVERLKITERVAKLRRMAERGGPEGRIALNILHQMGEPL